MREVDLNISVMGRRGFLQAFALLSLGGSHLDFPKPLLGLLVKNPSLLSSTDGCCLPSIFGQRKHDQGLRIAKRTPRFL